MNRRQFFQLIPAAAAAGAVVTSLKPRALPASAPALEREESAWSGIWLVKRAEAVFFDGRFEQMVELIQDFPSPGLPEARFAALETLLRTQGDSLRILDKVYLDRSYLRVGVVARFSRSASLLRVGDVVEFGTDGSRKVGFMPSACVVCSGGS